MDPTPPVRADRPRRHAQTVRRRAVTGPMLFLLVLSALWSAFPASAAEVVWPDRESSYPAEITNITHEPWHPAWGEDVTVTVRLADDAPGPDMMSLLFCRVEPGYACGLPDIMHSEDDGRTWMGTIAWDDRFMQPGLRHIGYNITLHYDDGETRVYAPTGNYAIPETYPEEADGIYFFYAVGPEEASLPGPFLGPVILLLAGLALVRRPPRPHGRRPHDG